MKKIVVFIIPLLVLFLISCESGGSTVEQKKGKVPGIETMRKYGTRLTPETLLDEIAFAMKGVTGGNVALSIYNEVLRAQNNDPLFIIENISYNEDGLATDIQGRVETPNTIKGYIAKGGGGIPIYEPIEPNEFGVIFGRKGNIAIRDNVVVLKNSLEEEELYSLKLGSEIYDKIMSASLLFQAYEVAQKQYLENMIIELEGILLNSSSKQAILDGIKQFKEENKKMSDKEVMINFLTANKSYLEELKKSNQEAFKRIEQSGELVEAIEAGCTLQVVAIAEMFVKMALDTADIFSDPMNASRIANMTARYLKKNIPSDPKFSAMTMSDLNNIEKYGKYYQKRYEDYIKKNKVLLEKVKEIKKIIKL